MTRQQLGLALGNFCELAFEDFGDARMQHAPLLPQQRTVGCVLHQRMLEQVARIGWGAPSKQQTRRNEPVEVGVQFRLRLSHQRSQQHVGKFPADRRADLRHVLCRAEPVEPRHQRSLQACRNRHDRRWCPCEGPLHIALTLRVQHRLGHLLGEQWNAVGALNDVLADARRQRSVADDPLDQEIDVARRQPMEGQLSHVRPSDPGRAEFRPESDKQQEPVALGPVHRPGEQFEAGRIGPMRIFENHQHGIDPHQHLEVRTKRFQRFLTTELRLNFNRRVASIVGQRQHFGKQRRILGRRRALRQQRVKLVHFRLLAVIVSKASGAQHLADHRIERTVGMLRRAEEPQAYVGLARKLFQQRDGEP